MKYLESLPIKIISVIIIFFFSWTFSGFVDIAYAIDQKLKQSLNENKEPKKDKLGKKFEKTLNELEKIIKDVETDTLTKKNKVKGKKSEIESLNVEIKKQFADNEKKLKDEGLPYEILERHDNFVKHYEKNLKELQKNLDALEKAKDKNETDDAIENTKKFLEKVKPPKKHIPLDPNKLPHATAEPTFIEPRTNPEEFKEYKEQIAKRIEQKPILVASAGSLKGLLNSTYPGTNELTHILLAQTSNPPNSADLEETIEVKFTPEISQLAADLEHNPVKIFNFVKNYIDFVPTYGSIQGSQQTLLTGKGNAFDQASLLIALLRVSGISARYEYGTIEVPIEKIKNWVGGFTDSMAALNLMASGRIPVKGLIEGGTIKAVQLEHIWVKAWIDYIPSRGAVHKQGDTWIILDPSFKQYDYTSGVDFKTAVPFDTQSFINDIEATAIINEAEGSITGVDTNLAQTIVDSYASELENYLNTNYPNAIEELLVHNGKIARKELPFLPLNLPYTVKAKGWEASNLPSNLRHKIQFSVIKDIYDEYIGTPINYSISLPEIVGKRITLSYAPATDADRAVIRSLIPKAHSDGTPLQISELPSSFPAYLINLKPELRIDGQVVTTATTVTLGYSEQFTITLQSPTRSIQAVNKEVIAGEFYAVGINVMPLGEDDVEEKITNHYGFLQDVKEEMIYLNKDQFIGEFLHTIATGYFDQYNEFEKIFAKLTSIVAHRLPSIGIVQSNLHINYIYGMPYTANPEGVFLDIAYTNSMAVSLDGNSENVINYHFVSGLYGSGLEHSILEQLYSTVATPIEGVSTVKILSVANSQDIPIYTITSSNSATVLLKLQTGINDIIQNAVNAGKEVITPESNVTINGWTGTGYIIFDPATGSGAYMISGAKNGGYLTALGNYWIACGAVIYDDDPLFGMEVIMAGINLIIEAQTLWLDVLKVGGKAAFEFLTMFVPWGKIAGSVKFAFAGTILPKVSKAISKGHRFEPFIIKSVLKLQKTVDLELLAKYRTIPDAIIYDALNNPKVLWEVKSGMKVYTSSGNIKKLLTVSQEKGIPLNLVVREEAYIAPDLIPKIEATGGKIYKFIEATGELYY